MILISVCVGSLNPTKKNAVKEAFNSYFKHFKLYNIKADSKVSKQPFGFKNILDGAINRAKCSLKFLKIEKELHFHATSNPW